MTEPEGELITVQSFAIRYRVEASIVRAWIKRGAIPYELVGPRKMRLRPSAVAIPIQPSAIVGRFDDYPLGDNYMRLVTPISSISGGTNGSGQQGASASRQTGMGEGSNEGSDDSGSPKAARRDVEHSGRLAPLPSIPRGSRRTA